MASHLLENYASYSKTVTVAATESVSVTVPERDDVLVATLWCISRRTICRLSLTYTVSVWTAVVVMVDMLRYEEQKALAGFCCFKAVTTLFIAGHIATAGEVVTAGIGFAPAKAERAKTTSESMMDARHGTRWTTETVTKGVRSLAGITEVLYLQVHAVVAILSTRV